VISSIDLGFGLEAQGLCFDLATRDVNKATRYQAKAKVGKAEDKAKAARK